jgi:hypothetical protein
MVVEPSECLYNFSIQNNIFECIINFLLLYLVKFNKTTIVTQKTPFINSQKKKLLLILTTVN